MNNEDKSKKFINQNVNSIIAILIALIVIIGGTYALFTQTLIGAKTNVLRAQSLSLILDDRLSNGINLIDTMPKSDTKGLTTTAYIFTLRNNSSLNSDYIIYLDDLALNTKEVRMNDKYVKYSLVKNNGVATTALLTTIGSNPNRILDEGSISANTTNSYTLRMWIDSEADNEVMGTVFLGQLRVNAIQK